MINKVYEIEEFIGHELPEDYKRFLIQDDMKKYNGLVFPVIFNDDWVEDWRIEEFADLNTFKDENKYRNHFEDFAKDLVDDSKLDGKTLYYIAYTQNAGVCMSMFGDNLGKIYSVDNGDFGLTYLDTGIYSFVESIFDENDEC